MTKMFGNVTTAGLESAGDRIGGGRQLLESGIYTGTVKLAYAGKAKSSASQSVTVHLDINGQEHRETFWVTNKQGENFYADKQDPKKKFPIPGYASIDELCLVTTGFPLSEQDGAEQHFAEEGKLEVDDNALVSIGDEDGAYVMVWHWVTNAAADIENSEDTVDSRGRSEGSRHNTTPKPNGADVSPVSKRDD